MSYLFRLDPAPKAKDQVLQFDDVSVYVDSKSYALLDGLVLDWKESLMESAFVWNNPNVSRSCSCGKSFAIG